MYMFTHLVCYYTYRLGDLLAIMEGVLVSLFIASAGDRVFGLWWDQARNLKQLNFCSFSAFKNEAPLIYITSTYAFNGIVEITLNI